MVATSGGWSRKLDRWSRDTHGTPQEPRVISKTHARDFPGSICRTYVTVARIQIGQVESNGLPSRSKSKFMVREPKAPLAFKDVCRYLTAEKTCARSSKERSSKRATCASFPHDAIARARVDDGGSSKNDFFIARLRARYEKPCVEYV